MDNPTLNAALRLLKYRARSCWELDNRLRQKKFPNSKINEVLDYLIELGYVDDEEFASLFATDKIKQYGVGPIYLHSELSKHNIPDEHINNAIQRGYKNFPLDEVIIKHIKKRNKILNSKNILVKKRKIIQFLQRKGFTWEQISPYLNKIFPDQ